MTAGSTTSTPDRAAHLPASSIAWCAAWCAPYEENTMLGRRHGFRFFSLTATAALACASHASTTVESFGDAGKPSPAVDGGALAQHSDARVAPVDAAPTSQCSGATHTVGTPPGPTPLRPP